MTNQMNTKMQTADKLAVTKPSALQLMASRVSVDPTKLVDSLKATVFKNCTNEELLALVVVANEYDLNPFLKEIYAFPAKGGGIVPIISVDGWNKMLIRHPDFDGIEFEMAEDEAGNPHSCTATIYCKTRSKPVRITEYLDECKRNTEPWNNMPRRMLRNRTLCQASRVAFGFSGRSEEELDAITVESTIIPNSPPPKSIPVTSSEPLKNVQQELQECVELAGHTFDDLLKWGERTGNIEDADSLPNWESVPNEVARRLLRASKGLLTGLAAGKVAAP